MFVGMVTCSRKSIALKRWRVRERRWNRQIDSRGSIVLLSFFFEGLIGLVQVQNNCTFSVSNRLLLKLMANRGGQITRSNVIQLKITNYWKKCNWITNYKLHLIVWPNYNLPISNFKFRLCLASSELWRLKSSYCIVGLLYCK